jgi:sugar phosphate isomerase/epimerase
MKYYAETAQQYNLQVLLKPHGGISSSGSLCAEAVRRVGSENFRICYDPANIFYYDGYDPVEELKIVIEYVKAMCVKDYHIIDSGKPDVLITPGDGKVNFPEVFRILKEGNFSRFCIIECLSGSTYDEINREAKRAYNYISDFIW